MRVCEQARTVHQDVVLVLHSPGRVGTAGQERPVVCDHVRVWSSEKGNYDFHQTAMKKIAKLYKEKLPGLRYMKIKTDGAPTQYKCRQNLWQVARAHVDQETGVVQLHDFAATSHFGGPHDSVGKEFKREYKKAVLKGTS
jgi:hypothetical protein